MGGDGVTQRGGEKAGREVRAARATTAVLGRVMLLFVDVGMGADRGTSAALGDTTHPAALSANAPATSPVIPSCLLVISLCISPSWLQQRGPGKLTTRGSELREICMCLHLAHLSRAQ